MPKRKNLNGLPHNLTRSFFGTERYDGRGYMADWLLNGAQKLNISNASLDIINQTISPTELNLSPLLFHLKDLSSIIQKELKANGFPTDFITEAKIEVEFLDPKNHGQTFYCYPYMVDKEGHRYETGRIIETAWETKFDPFIWQNNYRSKRTFMAKIKSLFKS